MSRSMNNNTRIALILAKWPAHRILQAQRLCNAGMPAAEAIALVQRLCNAVNGVRS